MYFSYFTGITRLPVLEGEVSHVEIPRTSSSLGITIVGGADTPLVSSDTHRYKHNMYEYVPHLFVQWEKDTV